VRRQDVLALCEKYRELRRLRQEHAAGETAHPRAALVALSRRFPGALRELDQLPMQRIEARLSQLEATLAGAAEPPRWARLQDAYHGALRVALSVKRRAAGGESVENLARELADDPEATRRLGPVDVALLRGLLSPPDGRLNRWVFARVAGREGVERVVVEQALLDA
jgi:hypothetical protein